MFVCLNEISMLPTQLNEIIKKMTIKVLVTFYSVFTVAGLCACFRQSTRLQSSFCDVSYYIDYFDQWYWLVNFIAEFKYN